jgi:hypothetical protein
VRTTDKAKQDLQPKSLNDVMSVAGTARIEEIGRADLAEMGGRTDP